MYACIDEERCYDPMRVSGIYSIGYTFLYRRMPRDRSGGFGDIYF
jgi:hypothetical protein